MLGPWQAGPARSHCAQRGMGAWTWCVMDRPRQSGFCLLRCCCRCRQGMLVFVLPRLHTQCVCISAPPAAQANVAAVKGKTVRRAAAGSAEAAPQASVHFKAGRSNRHPPVSYRLTCKSPAAQGSKAVVWGCSFLWSCLPVAHTAAAGHGCHGCASPEQPSRSASLTPRFISSVSAASAGSAAGGAAGSAAVAVRAGVGCAAAARRCRVLLGADCAREPGLERGDVMFRAGRRLLLLSGTGRAVGLLSKDGTADRATQTAVGETRWQGGHLRRRRRMGTQHPPTHHHITRCGGRVKQHPRPSWPA